MSGWFDPNVADALARLPDYLGQHVDAQRQRDPAGIAVRLAACGRRPALAALPRDPARRHRPCPDHSGPRFARAVLPAAARTLAPHHRGVRPAILGARLPAVAAGAHALQHAADPAEHHHRRARRRCVDQAGRHRRRHDADAVAAPGGAAARASDDHGRRAHGRCLGDRHCDALHRRRADQPWQLHLHRPADAELDLRPLRLRRRRDPGAAGRCAAGEHRILAHQPQQARSRSCRRGDSARVGREQSARLGERWWTIRDRLKALCRAICARRPVAAAPERCGPGREPARRPRLHGRVRCARRRRHRPLCRLHRHDLDQCDAPERVHLARSGARAKSAPGSRPITG